MKLIDFLKTTQKLVEQKPEVLQWEMIGDVGSSGVPYEVSGGPYVSRVSDWDDREFPLREMLPNDYPFDHFIKLYLGN